MVREPFLRGYHAEAPDEKSEHLRPAMSMLVSAKDPTRRSPHLAAAVGAEGRPSFLYARGPRRNLVETHGAHEGIHSGMLDDDEGG